ncbi:uncharacterized protein LOC129919846 [Episyrphus balteatus]|uniref:uncharacterized protein LOC129919846 n=1 Tax=Episyrphus balteatus TaxID=286459 RepID=UPI0024852EEC|nr:uncharacterized protein LOC129919846 [Episyrphus balteatus]
MKFIAVLLIVSAFAAFALASPHHKEGHEGTECHYHCEEEKPLDKPLSTHNGTCRREFVNECELEMFNCVNHPEKQFEKMSEDQKSAHHDKPLPLCEDEKKE